MVTELHEATNAPRVRAGDFNNTVTSQSLFTHCLKSDLPFPVGRARASFPGFSIVWNVTQRVESVVDHALVSGAKYTMRLAT
jgi:hypothetical protein